jgi:DNA repair exonuclease SbcCD nuclease subunit
MITGNHDPDSPLGIFNRIDASLYPDHLTVVNGRKTLELEEGAVLYAASPSEKNGTENPLAWIPQRSAGQGIRIGLAHGSLAIPGRHKSDDFPIPPSFAEEAELDYLALGHWHSRYIHDQRTAYPGTHEPLGFGERSGALEVEIPGGGEAPVITPVEIEPHFTWRSEQRRFSGSLPEEILDLLRSSAPREILRLHAEGELSAGEQETLQTAKEIAAENRFALFTEDHTRIAGEIEGLAETEGIGYLAQVIRRMEEGETVSAPSGSWGSVDTAEVRDAALRRIRDFLKREELL